MNYVCKFCGKKYTKESTLLSHMCEPQRRHKQQNEQGVQIGFKAYIKFYEMTQGSAKFKTYEDFCNSNFYIAFVKFGRYAVDIRAINVAGFIEWLIKNNHKLDYWTKEKLYVDWLFQQLRKEPAQDAIERALKEMQEYSDSDAKLENNFANYFRLGSSNRICQHVVDGRVSPWIVYNCVSGVEWLSQLNEEQLQIVMPVIDPNFWQQRFHDFLSDTEWTKMILREAGL